MSNEFYWSIVGSGTFAAVATPVGNQWFNQHWNFFVVWLAVFAVYWIVRFGGDIIADIFDVG